jgi:hypothetical protein
MIFARPKRIARRAERSAPPGRRRTRAIVHGAAPALALALAALVWVRAERMDEAPPRVAPPTLPELEAVCAAAPPARLERARAASAAAAQKIARYPLAPAEGLPALQLLLESERCFALAGDTASRAAARLRASALRARLERDCRDHFLRYRLARTSGRSQPALAAVDFLLALLEHHGGAAVDQLRRARHELRADNVREEMP